MVNNVKETHQMAEMNQERNDKLKNALGISPYFIEGSSLDPDRKAKEALAKSEEMQKYELLEDTPSPESSPKAVASKVKVIEKKDKDKDKEKHKREEKAEKVKDKNEKTAKQTQQSEKPKDDKIERRDKREKQPSEEIERDRDREKPRKEIPKRYAIDERKVKIMIEVVDVIVVNVIDMIRIAQGQDREKK
ncbi:nucleolar GTPase/ATPase p130-like protein [Dinothrombium tinctorium]|uniref:Nucleolar GTPase/ATPase p130-like protein n=1 Tax=Dinothrombium tinctorium TaxID=1965070 RepID=A0A443R8Y3_9ACAR|nr:nucleolar GTPase/ATPase p130-like protein [Dinothrombium tinctorium]